MDEAGFGQRAKTGNGDQGVCKSVEVVKVLVYEVECEAGYDVCLYEHGWAPVIKDDVLGQPLLDNGPLVEAPVSVNIGKSIRMSLAAAL